MSRQVSRAATVPTARFRVARVASFVFLAAAVALASGVYRQTKHGDPVTGVQRLQDQARGECSQCHDEHASRDGNATGGPYPYLLFAPNDNQLCATCHSISGSLGIYQGLTAYGNSSHGTSPSMIWPGPTPPGRPSSDGNKCVNCHDPHGASDATGQIPAMTASREESLCLACHDGSPATTDLQSLFQRLYRHPIATTGKHLEDEAGDATKFAASPVNNRHSECEDCHNGHTAQRDVMPPIAPAASARLSGVSRIRVVNGLAGTKPIYTYAGPGDTTPANEYEICFKCHSSWTTQPAGQSDLGTLLNPSNPSFHPVEAKGRNANIPAAAFVSPWTWDRLTYCTDCHSADGIAARGPHGSTYRSILKKSSSTLPGSQLSVPTDLCFDCHDYNVYGNGSSSSALQANSRFNLPASSNGHAFHVGSQSISCYTCHQTHGSALLPGLMATGRVPGVLSYTQTPTGGTCTPSCHGTATYTVNYAR